MRSPFRSEEAAFQFLLLTIGAFALIALASWIDSWLGLAVFLSLTVAAVVVYTRGRSGPPARLHVERSDETVRRILVIANETVGGRELHELIARRVDGQHEEVLVVCPALNSRVRTWASDEDGARAVAQTRLQASLDRLAVEGISARGEVGDGDPVQAIEDALVTFAADEIIVSTHPEGRSNWLERGVVAAVEERVDVPVWHVVVEGA